jgi:hypothetical protein
MTPTEIIDRLEERKDANVSKREMINLLQGITPNLITVDKVQTGDTFYYKVVGGKVRPWVVLWVRKGVVGAATITHSDMPFGYACQCRFWVGSFIGPTVTLLDESFIKDKIYLPYTNKKHLTEVRNSIRKVWK